jgi:hypothetical protein
VAQDHSAQALPSGLGEACAAIARAVAGRAFGSSAAPVGSLAPSSGPTRKAQPACIGDAPAEQAAGALGLSRTRFYTLMRRYGLS